jgi:RND family efflux transporter MFP subunit
MKNKFALASVLAAIAIGTVAIAQQPQRVAKVGGYGSAGGITSPLDKAPFRVGLVYEAQVPAEEAGVLVKVNVREGHHLKAEQPLAKINDSQAVMQHRVATAEHKAAEEKASSTVDIRYAKAASEVAKAEWEKSRQANKKQPGTVSDIEVERQRLTYHRGLLEIERAQSEQVIARLTADAKKVEIDAAEEAIRRRVIRAPVDCVVVQVYLHEGEWVKPGDPVFHVMKLDKLQVEGDIEFARFSPSQIIDKPVTVEATLQERKVTFEGRIIFVKPLLDPSGKRFQVQAEVENRQENGHWVLWPGMLVDMTIHMK